MTLVLSQHRVLKVEKQLVEAGLDSFWAYRFSTDHSLRPGAGAPGGAPSLAQINPWLTDRTDPAPLHAPELGFTHPRTGETLRFESAPVRQAATAQTRALTPVIRADFPNLL